MNEDVMLRADEKKINWYPGHMARAKRALADQLSRVDVVVELCDARIPRASRNPDLADMIKNNEFGKLVVVKNNVITDIPLAESAGKLKYVDPQSDIVKEAKLIGISFGD